MSLEPWIDLHKNFQNGGKRQRYPARQSKGFHQTPSRRSNCRNNSWPRFPLWKATWRTWNSDWTRQRGVCLTCPPLMRRRRTCPALMQQRPMWPPLMQLRLRWKTSTRTWLVPITTSMVWIRTWLVPITTSMVWMAGWTLLKASCVLCQVI